MNAKVSMLLTAVWLAGCSTQPALPPATSAAITPFNYLRPVPEGELKQSVPRACQLGASCLTMDPRPFEACLLSTTKSCADKGAEALRVVK